MNAMAKKWVWFDLDDTLHDFSSAARQATTSILKMLADGAQLPIAEVEANYRLILQAHHKAAFADGRTSNEYRAERFMGAIKGHVLSDSAAQDLINNAVAAYENIYMNSLKIKQDAIEALQSLKDTGYALAILSDAPPDAQSRVIKKLGIDKFFDRIFTSGSLQLSKQQGMFGVVLDRLSAQPQNVTMVGDSLERDILPALDSHIKAVWFNEKRLPNPLGYREIHLLKQLPHIIERMNGKSQNE